MEHCRITCGIAAGSSVVTDPIVDEMLYAFEGAPVPAEPWLQLPPLQLRTFDEVNVQRYGPRIGVMVCPCANVTLRYNTIACCAGPGIKVTRGRLLAERNTIAFSRCGANVVSNNGRVVLKNNRIHEAQGDGVTLWNRSSAEFQCNIIHSNFGKGIAVHASAGQIKVIQNSFYDNTEAAVQFTTLLTDSVILGEGCQANDWSRNVAGGVQCFEDCFVIRRQPRR